MMKKILSAIIVLCALSCVSTANAQIRYGAIAGVSFNDLKFNQGGLIGVEGNIGYSVGGFSEFMFPGIGFGVDAGLMYSQRGATLNMDKYIWEIDGYGKERTNLHYIEIPINLRFKYHRLNGFEDYLAPFVFGGPSFSIGVGHSTNKAIDFAAGDVGLQVGLGVEVLKHWQLSGFYNWGMTDCLKTVKLNDFAARNRSWNIRLAYLF